MSRYRKLPVEIDAVQWTGDNAAELDAFAGANFAPTHPDDRDGDPESTAAVFDVLHSTWVLAYDGQWIIRGIKGEFYPCAGDVFAATYEAVS